MKGKQLFLLLVLAALASGAWYYFTQRNRAAWSETGGGGGKVIEFPINDVAHLRIKDADGELNLVKKDDAWVVKERGGYPANFEQVGGLIRKLWELKTVQEVKVGASQLPRLALVEPGKGDKSGTLVELLSADGKTLASLLLGKKHLRASAGGAGDTSMDVGGIPTGRYLKPTGGEKVSVVADPLDEVDPKPPLWILRDFLKIQGPKSITVAGPADAKKWKVTRNSAEDEWKLADAKPEETVDSGKTSALGSILSSPTLEDVLTADAKPEETGLDKPTVATIETFEGFSYTLKIGKPNGATTPVQVAVTANLAKERTPGKDEKPEDKAKLDEQFKAEQKRLEEKLAKEQKVAGRAYLLPQFALDPLLKDRSALLADKPAEPAPAPAPTPGALTPPAPAPVPSAPAPAAPAAAPSAPAPKPPAPAPTPEAAPATPPAAPKPAGEPAPKP